MDFTGERMIPEHNNGREIYLEHMARYKFASNFTSGKSVLDIACGSGYGADYLCEQGAARVLGVDISEEAIRYCRKKYSGSKIEFLIGDVKKIPLKDNSVDAVVSFETIEHVDENVQKKFIEEIARVLRRDGTLIISTPNSLINTGENPYHLKEFSLEEFKIFLESKFKYVSILYQFEVESSFIFSEKMLDKQTEESSGGDVKVNRFFSYEKEDAYFFVAVCSNVESPDSHFGQIYLFNDLEKKALSNLINEKDILIKKNEEMVIERNKYIKKLEEQIKVLKRYNVDKV